MTDDFFRARIEQMIDLRHPLAVLASRMPWAELERRLAPFFAREDRVGEALEGADLLGPTVTVAGAGVSAAGRPRLPLRLMAALLYLKHSHNLSDEELVARWSENVVWQYFSGQEYYGPRLPCDATQLGRFRRLLGEAGVEELLAITIEAAVGMKAIKPAEFECVIVDTTVQEKAVAHPTDSRLLEAARAKIATLAQRVGIELKQTYQREGKQLARRAGGYAHAKQFRRMRRAISRQRTILGRLLRDVERKSAALSEEARTALDVWLTRAWRIRQQRPHDKAKLYALHAPEVECIGKGKARKPDEFGVKVGVAVTAKSGLMVGARSFAGNPYDGHILAAQLEQTAILLDNVGQAPKVVVTDLGFRGVDDTVAPARLVHRGKFRTLSKRERKLIRRRSAVEPAIGHVKDDCGLRRCWLKGAEGDALHAVLCAAGYNIRWLLRAIARLGLKRLYLRLILVALPRLLQRVPVGANLPSAYLHPRVA